MNERQITMQAIRYLAQVSEAIHSAVFHGGGPLSNGAMEASLKCADHIEHIAQYDVEQLDVRTRLRGIEESMRWLHVTRERFDGLLSKSHQYVPFASDVQTLASIANRLEQET
jgi:hypothetical protein